MLIYVAVVRERLKPVALRYFNTESGVFKEQPYRPIPECAYLSVMNGETLGKEDTGTCCLLGKYGQFYVVTLDCLNMHYMSKSELLSYRPVNYVVTQSNKVVLKKGKLQNLAHLFSNDTFRLSGVISRACSAGIWNKVAGYDIETGRSGVIKYPVCYDLTLLSYEVLYYQIGKQLDLPVCEAKQGVCCGRNCVLSIYEYGATDTWISFAKYMKLHNLKDEFEVAERLNQTELFYCYLLLDYVCNQSDRHSRNLAVCNNSIYPLYDNDWAFLETIGASSSHYRWLLRGNIAQWYSQYPRVRECFERLKAVNFSYYPLARDMISQNLKDLEDLL